jgi:hypothetical protein
VKKGASLKFDTPAGDDLWRNNLSLRENCFSVRNLFVSDRGCQMACFQTKNSNLGKFLGVLRWKVLVYFMAVWYILRPFGTFCGHLIYIFYGYLAYVFQFWYVAPRKKSGIPVSDDVAKFSAPMTISRSRMATTGIRVTRLV